MDEAQAAPDAPTPGDPSSAYSYSLR